MRTPLSSAKRPSRCRSRSLANQTYSTQAAATITPVEPNVQATSTTGVSKKKLGSLRTNNHSMSDAKITRAATAAVRCQSRPIPDVREMKAQRYARASRAGTHLGTGCHTWTKVPLLRPMTPSQIRTAAKQAWPALTMRMRPLDELIDQGKRVLAAVPNRGTALAAQAAQLPGPGPRDNRVGLLCLAVFEHAEALEHKGAALGADSSHESLEPDKRCRAVAAVHHQVFDLSLALDLSSEGLGDAGPSEFWQVLALTIGLFIPGLDGESRIRGVLHEGSTC